MANISKFSSAAYPKFIISESDGDKLVSITLPRNSIESSNLSFRTLYLEEI